MVQENTAAPLERPAPPDAGKTQMGDLSDLQRFTAQFAAVISYIFK